MRDEYDKFKKRDAAVIAVGPNTQAAFQQYWQQEGIPFTGVPDPGHAIAVKYRQQVNLFRLGRMPLLCVIDKQGDIRYVHSGASMSDIPSNQDLLDVIDALEGASKE
jgi:peroxiredoxin Q/BCP